MTDEKEPTELVCTRLADMTNMHPQQIETICYKCGHMVGIYPTGQRALKKYPNMRVKCINCAMKVMKSDDEVLSAGTPDEVVQEMRESKPVIIQ